MKKTFVMTLLASTVMTSAYANDMSKCGYQKDIALKYEGKIEKAETVTRDISLDKLDGETVMKCTVAMNLTIDGKPHVSTSSFIFDGDMPSNRACKRAEERAKEDALAKHSAQWLQGKQTMKCGKPLVTKDKSVVVAKNTQPPPPAVPVKPVETVTLEPISPNLTSHVVVKPRRRTRTTIIGMPVHTTDPRMRWSDVGPTASCHRVPVTVWIQGYRRVSSKEVCYE